jgi:cell division transport system permease protein
MTSAVSNGDEGSQDAANRPLLRRDAPMVPASSIAGRALTTVVAIMTFLACFTVGGTFLVVNASQAWRSDISAEVTIQVKPTAGVDTDSAVQKTADLARNIAGVGAVTVYSKRDSESMLQPWLGSGLDLDELPIPRLIVLTTAANASIDISGLEGALSTNGLSASVTDQQKWLKRLDAITAAIATIAVALCLLMTAAMTLAIGFATRGAMVGSREVIEVLHFVGAEDGFISRQFQKHFLALGLKGALAGGGAAICFFYLTGLLATRWMGTASGQDISLVFGVFDLGLRGFFAIFATALALAFLTGGVSRLVVHHHLRSLE